ncbi:RraA family protein [Diaminobutyricimonas sp. TR449]|uniref:RraA family protein n=1 Tax=Diaminobutyricimonas sp. TR449 TaxID=2708076 RepID=UPI00142313F6|nr:RraA family protein [Diaminobutyricimonas sp. TR449]
METSAPDTATTLLDQLLSIGTSTVYEGSGQDWWVDPKIRPAWSGARLVGPAFTAKAAYGDNLAIQRAVREAPAGSVLVIDAEDGQFGHWGGILTEIAVLRRLAGLVIYGTVRDIDEIESIGFPVFATGIAMQHARKSEPGTIGEPISLAGRDVATGDVVIADADGVVIVPQREVDSALAKAQQRVERERIRIETIRNGEVPPMTADTKLTA